MSRRRYITQQRLTQLRWKLNAHEGAVLDDVAAMRLAKATDLETLQQLRSPMTVRHFRRVLKQLADQGVLHRLERTIGGRRAGSAGFVYGLGIAGQRLLAADQHLHPRRTWTPRPAWLSHALSVSHLYVLLRQAEANDRVKLLTFEPEPLCWRRFIAPHGANVALKADAYLELATNGYRDSFFIEVDCGTESPATLTRKLSVYRQYWQSGVEQAAHGVFPRVLWLVPTTKRLNVMNDVVDQQPPDSHALHRVALYDHTLDAFIEEPP